MDSQEGQTEKPRVAEPKTPFGEWKRTNSLTVEGRGGSEPWGEHGKGDQANAEGRRSKKPKFRGGKPALRQTLKKMAQEGQVSDDLLV